MTALPTLVSAVLPGPARQRADGFAWWYADLVDDDGNGVVAILSLGLPFLPGGGAPMRPSVSFAVVEKGRPTFWALHEVDPEDVLWTPTAVRLGASTVNVVTGPQGVRWVALLEGQLPGCAWRAQITVDGPLRRSTPDEPTQADHEWSVLTAVARGTATLEAGPTKVSIEGRAYVDRNSGNQGLGQLSIDDWTWGRLAFPDHERIWYSAVDAEGVHHSLDVTLGKDGATTLVRDRVLRQGRQRGRWGLPYPKAIVLEPDLTVPLPRPIDDSPFYARFRLETPHGGAVIPGFAEVCRPARLEAAWFRPLHRMAICHDHRPDLNSAWLPLFAGPSRGRWSRLFGWSS